MIKTQVRILIVDDDEDDIDIFREAIEELDPSVKCLSAFNGLEALSLLAKLHTKLPDYIFLDLNMPKLNGKCCLAELKKSSVYRQIPVIIYTTSRLESDIEETRRLGASYFLT